MPGSLGSALFRGRQLHSRDYRTVDEFTGTQVIVVGGGISVLQHLDESQTMPLNTPIHVTSKSAEWTWVPADLTSFGYDRGRVIR